MAFTVQGSKVGSGRGGLATIRRVRSDPMPRAFAPVGGIEPAGR